LFRLLFPACRGVEELDIQDEVVIRFQAQNKQCQRVYYWTLKDPPVWRLPKCHVQRVGWMDTTTSLYPENVLVHTSDIGSRRRTSDCLDIAELDLLTDNAETDALGSPSQEILHEPVHIEKILMTKDWRQGVG
jgi:hypothetical protein